MLLQMEEEKHSLEDWIAVKRDLFSRDELKDKINFLLAWNQFEQKLAITCIEGTRRASDRKSKAFARLVSLEFLQNINAQLCLINPKIDVYFSELSNIIRQHSLSSRLITYLYGGGTFDGDKLCSEIEQYLKEALSIFGKNLLITILFDDDPLNDYEENIQELKIKGYENLLKGETDELKDIIKLRYQAQTLLEMTTIYVIEEKAISNVIIALTEMYNYQLQPFVKMREIAFQRMNSAKDKIENPDLGKRVKNEADKEFTEFKEHFLSSTEAIHQLYQDYYRRIIRILDKQYERMKEDKRKFGQSAFQVQGANEKLQKLEVSLCEENLKLLNAIKLSKVHQLDQVKEQMKKVAMNKVDLKKIEKELYEVQIGVCDAELDIFAEQEKLYKMQIAHLKNVNQQEIDNLFYDAVENEEDLDEQTNDEELLMSININNHEMKNLKEKLKQVSRKRAHIRSKRNTLLSNKIDEQNQSAQLRNNFIKHHSANMKRIKKLEDEKKNQELLKETRKKTLQRLKAYKSKMSKRNQKDDLNEDSLPPYPSLNEEISNQDDLPLPPPEVLENNNSKVSSLSQSCLPPPPPPPLPTASFISSAASSKLPDQSSKSSMVPPPPPPPPTLSPLNTTSGFSLPKKIELKKTELPTNKSNNFGLIDLNELLKMRNKLKAPKVQSQEKSSNENHPDNILQATLQRMRTVISDSNSEKEESDSEFDD